MSRFISGNDLSVGRSPAEVLRTLQALLSGGLCAADWRKGEGFVG
jgi:peroxiredoxin (alkyl hydroperoxide reductase subunit C)